MVTHSYQFNIDRCTEDKTKSKKCHDETQINNWMEDVNVEIWTMQKSIDFTKYTADPTYWTNKLYSS